MLKNEKDLINLAVQVCKNNETIIKYMIESLIENDIIDLSEEGRPYYSSCGEYLGGGTYCGD